jgi:hypothetical protein
LINSLFPKFRQIVCFSEHNLKHIDLDQIKLEGYELGAAYCRKSLLKGGFASLLIKKYNYSNGDLNKYCKEQDIEACALKLELTALTIHVVTVYRAPCGNFNSCLWTRSLYPNLFSLPYPMIRLFIMSTPSFHYSHPSLNKVFFLFSYVS